MIDLTFAGLKKIADRLAIDPDAEVSYVDLILAGVRFRVRASQLHDPVREIIDLIITAGRMAARGLVTFQIFHKRIGTANSLRLLLQFPETTGFRRTVVPVEIIGIEAVGDPAIDLPDDRNGHERVELRKIIL